MTDDLIPLAHLALWCPYCDDMVNPQRCTDEDLPQILQCPKCHRSIAHAVPDNAPEAVRQVLTRMATGASPPS
jgi:hypothetical protein